MNRNFFACRSLFSCPLLYNFITQTTFCLRKTFTDFFKLFRLFFLLLLYAFLRQFVQLLKGCNSIPILCIFPNTFDLYFINRVFLSDSINNRLPFHHSTKNSMFSVEPWGGYMCDKKLTSIRSGTSVCHRQYAWLIMS